MSDFQNHCKVPQGKLIDFLLNELTLEETVETYNHLRKCKECNTFVDFNVTAFKAVREIPLPDVSTETYFRLKNRVLKTVAKTDKVSSTGSGRITQVSSLLLSVAAVLFFVTVMFSESISPSVNLMYEMQGQESWYVDSIITTSAMSTATPGHDSLSFLSNLPHFPHNIPVLMPKVQTRFYTFTADMLSPHTQL